MDVDYRDPAPAPVCASSEWAGNAEMILDCVRLRYLRKEWKTLDPTWGEGMWWVKWQPDDLTINANEWDFREAPFPDYSFDAIAYDPPYVCMGGRQTSTGTAVNLRDRFGLQDAPKTPALLQDLMNAGLAEMVRISRPKAMILMKCQDYISSGGLWPGTYYSIQHGFGLGLKLIDRMEHVSGLGPQPTHNQDGSVRRQVHARRNYSTLLVFQRP